MVKCVLIAVEKNFTYEMIAPVPELSELVDSFWSLESTSEEPQQVMILPDGRIDLSVSFPAAQQFTLLGLEDQPSSGTLKPGAHSCDNAKNAYELAECLLSDQFPDVKTAIAAFEKGMCARMAEMTQATLDATEMMHSTDPIQRMMKMFEGGEE